MSPSIALMSSRMKPLPRRHRIAHLRALIRQHPSGSARGRELADLLRAEMMAHPDKEERAR
jgi:hypothetical protein